MSSETFSCCEKSASGKYPRISFGIIVLNGEPFIRYCIRALYAHAHEIIVAEGAALCSKEFGSADGRSVDGTCDTLQRIKAEEDPEDKIIIVQREGNWASRDEQSSAYAERATGDYLWQVDSDEFYTPEAIESVRRLLAADPSISGAAFRWHIFWGGKDFVTDGFFQRGGGGDVNRLFRWGPGHRYGNHWKGPMVVDAEGRPVKETGRWLAAAETAGQGIFCYHYSLTFPSQVFMKTSIYNAGADPTNAAFSETDRWAFDVWRDLQNPFRVHNRYEHPAWLVRFKDPHPPAVEDMFADIASGRLKWETRPLEDVDKLLRSTRYRLKARVLAAIAEWEKGRSWKTRDRARWFVNIWVDQGAIALVPAVGRRLWEALLRRLGLLKKTPVE